MRFKRKELNSKTRIIYLNQFDQEILQYIDAIYQKNSKNSELILIQQRNDRDVYKLVLKTGTYYLKHYFFDPTDHNVPRKIRRILHKPRALKSFLYSTRLIDIEVKVAEPILASLYQKSTILGESIFVTKEYKGITLEEFFVSDASIPQKREAFKMFAALLVNLFNHNIYHNDVSLVNFLISESNGKLEIALIDLDSVRFKPRLSIGNICACLSKLSYYSHLNAGSNRNKNNYFEENLTEFLLLVLDLYKKDYNPDSFLALVYQKAAQYLSERGRADLISPESELYKYK